MKDIPDSFGFSQEELKCMERDGFECNSSDCAAVTGYNKPSSVENFSFHVLKLPEALQETFYLPEYLPDFMVTEKDGHVFDVLSIPAMMVREDEEVSINVLTRLSRNVGRAFALEDLNKDVSGPVRNVYERQIKKAGFDSIEHRVSYEKSSEEALKEIDLDSEER